MLEACWAFVWFLRFTAPVCTLPAARHGCFRLFAVGGGLAGTGRILKWIWEILHLRARLHRSLAHLHLGLSRWVALLGAWDLTLHVTRHLHRLVSRLWCGLPRVLMNLRGGRSRHHTRRLLWHLLPRALHSAQAHTFFSLQWAHTSTHILTSTRSSALAHLLHRTSWCNLHGI